jgi:hypothetical protein
LPQALASPLALVVGALLLAFHLRLAVLCLDPD